MLLRNVRKGYAAGSLGMTPDLAQNQDKHFILLKEQSICSGFSSYYDNECQTWEMHILVLKYSQIES